MSRTMSHREMELHKPHFIPARLCNEMWGSLKKWKWGGNFAGCWNDFVFHNISWGEKKRRWLRNWQIIRFKMRKYWKILGLRCCAFSCDSISGAYEKRKTISAVNKGDPSRTKPRCNICVYLSALLECFPWAMPGGRFCKQSNIPNPSGMCYPRRFTGSTGSQGRGLSVKCWALGVCLCIWGLF